LLPTLLLLKVKFVTSFELLKIMLSSSFIESLL
jgi:hypothetical protein